MTAPRPWPVLGSSKGPDLAIFRVRMDSVENPRTGRRMQRTVLEAPDWVNVIAVTPEGLIVTVEQQRFGIGRPTTEIPGGVVDPGEEPLAAARRELAEETGYEADTWTYLGSVQPNPAYLDNRCHHWLAQGAVPTADRHLDDGEDIVVGTMHPDELRRRILSGEIAHSLVLTAVCRVLDLRIATAS